MLVTVEVRKNFAGWESLILRLITVSVGSVFLFWKYLIDVNDGREYGRILEICLRFSK